MNIEMVKHSYHDAFATVPAQVACTVDGKYTRVFFEKDGTVVRQNTVGTNSKKIVSKVAKDIIAFVKANLDAAK